VSNFLAIGQTFAKICRFFHFSNVAAFPPSWICDARVRTTQGGHLVVFITVQNSVGIDAVVSITRMFFDFASLAWKCLFRSPKLGFWKNTTKPVHRLQICPIVHNWGGQSYYPSKLHPRPSSSVDVRPRRHTDTHTQTPVTTIHFASSTTHAKCNNLYCAKIVKRIRGAGTGWLDDKSGLEEVRL